MKAYGEQRYADALEAVRAALEHMPDHAGLHYNYACFATLAGDSGDETFAHLRRSVELFPRFREDARRDDDFRRRTRRPGSSRLFAERAGLHLRRAGLFRASPAKKTALLAPAVSHLGPPGAVFRT
jgi:hypothetical protein